MVQKLLFPVQQLPGVGAGDLADGQILPGDVELLVIAAEELLGALVRPAEGEEGAAQLLQVHLGDPGQALGHGDVPLGAGGRLEHDRVRQNGPGHEPGDLGTGHHAVFLIHGGEDGVGAAHGLVAHADGLGGLDIRQAVVVDDLQDLHLLQPGHGLGGLVVIHQHHLLPPGPQQMEAGQGARHPLLLIQDGVGPEAAFQHGLPHVVHIIVQVEGDDVFLRADLLHR